VLLKTMCAGTKTEAECNAVERTNIMSGLCTRLLLLPNPGILRDTNAGLA
jgi:hypothetical protein